MSAKTSLVLVLVAVSVLAAPLHAQLFGGLGGGNRAANNIQFMCIIGRRLQKRMDCDSDSHGMCGYIKNNLGRCGDSGSAMASLGGFVKRFNTGRSRAGRLTIPIPRMNM